ncbi:15-hydroxyprostaglandin dehydrogenase [NAD(+)]-like [Polyergus mexicanus]|uniref:15-hydroxyprostaglandin dehydrogenase [NAD(+)]-like n=1 Tax=Polyergus mexicanus TaxID=615972 RepID=UPI0038B59530
MDNIRNKTVMITGGAAGLGYKYAEILLRNGAKSVAIIDLPTSNGENAAITLENEFGKDRAIFVACDVTKTEDLKEAFKKVIDAFETLDILINNAGILNDKDKWELMININVTALIRSSYLALDHMGKYKGGRGGLIVNISSILGLTVHPPAPVYTATKHAVLGFSQSLAGLYEKTGVRVLVMCPGVTKTALIGDLFHKIISFIDAEHASKFPSLGQHQSADNVALAMVDLIQKGKNGEAWVSKDDKPPYAVNFPHYSTRALPV